MAKKSLTDRQLAIVDLIAERKTEGAETVSLDEIVKRVKRWGLSAHRNSLIISMNIIVKKLTDQGIYIEKVDNLGRGARQLYRIKRPL